MSIPDSRLEELNYNESGGRGGGGGGGVVKG